MDNSLLNAIKIGNEINLSYKSKINPSQEEQIVRVLPPQLGGETQIEVNCDGIIGTISISSDRTIHLHRLPLSKISGFIYSNELNGNKHSVISYSNELNSCWSRLIICKELSHIFLESEDNMTAPSVDKISDLLTGLVNKSIHNEQLAVENSAYFAAIEMLLPKSEVEKVYKDYIEPGATELSIAESYKIPVKAIEFRFSESVNMAYNEAYKLLKI